MNSNQGTNYSRWERWGTVAFTAYCLSMVFMIFFSTSAIQIWSYPWNRMSVLVACLLPLTLALVWKIPRFIREKKLEKQFLFISLIIILGLQNIVFSEDRPTTLKVMALFLISGIGIFAATSNLLNTKFRQTIFLWLCWALLLALCIYGSLEYINKKPILLFSFNPIPAGSLLILLFVGPFLLFPSSPRWLRFLQLLSIAFGIVVIVMIGKRGPILGLIGMAFLLGVLLPGRKFLIFPLIALILVGVGYQFRNHLPHDLKRNLTRNLITDFSTLDRLESYPFALQVFLKKPLFGVGLRAPLEKYVHDYQQKIVTRQNYSYSTQIKNYRTLENIILCGFVEMGSLFTFTYLGLVIYVLLKLFRSVRKRPESRLNAVLLLTVFCGFLIHSMTFDSLMYPHLNWLFHSLLGMMANFNEI